MTSIRSTVRLLAYLDEHFPGARVLDGEQLAQAARDTGLRAETIYYRIRYHGWRASFRQPSGHYGPLRNAIAERYPEGIVPRGVSGSLAGEFSVTRQRVSLVIKEMGYRVSPASAD